MTPSGQNVLVVLCLCVLVLSFVSPASAIPGTASDQCDVHRYAVYATDEDPVDVAGEPFTGVYENQSATARAVFDRARQLEGAFVTVNDSEWEAVWTLPNVVVVNETGTVYRTQRSSRECDLVGRLSAHPERFLPVLALAIVGLVAVLVHRVRRAGTDD